MLDYWWIASALTKVVNINQYELVSSILLFTTRVQSVQAGHTVPGKFVSRGDMSKHEHGPLLEKRDLRFLQHSACAWP